MWKGYHIWTPGWLWGPTIGNFENLEILDLPSPKGTKTRVHWGGGCMHIRNIIALFYLSMFILLLLLFSSAFCLGGGKLNSPCVACFFVPL